MALETTPDVPVEVQIQIVEADLQMWLNTRFQLTIRHRVNKRIGNDDAAKAVAEELVKVELTIEEYRAILDELQQPVPNGKVKA